MGDSCVVVGWRESFGDVAQDGKQPKSPLTPSLQVMSAPSDLVNLEQEGPEVERKGNLKTVWSCPGQLHELAGQVGRGLLGAPVRI